MESIMLKDICHFSGRDRIGGLVIALLLILGCNDSSDLLPGEVPEISLLEISHDSIVQYEEPLIITIQYQDGDGDLGFEDPERYALFVRDIRLEDFDNFYVGPLSPPGSDVAIEGDLNVEFPSLFLFGNGPSETTRFELKMIDRAGNESNLLTTPSVTILRE